MFPALPPQGAHPISPSPLLSSCSSGSCSVRDSPESLESKDTYGDNPPESKKKIQISYSKEQKLLLEKYFQKCMHPSQDEHMKFAEMIGVTEQQIQVWFKNQRVKYKKKYSHNVQQGVPETSGNSTADSGSTSSHAHLPVLASTNGEAMCPDSASRPDLPKGNEAPSDPGLTRDAALLMAPRDQEPEHAKASNPSLEECYQQIIEDFFDAIDDWLKFNYNMSPHKPCDI
ncbi:oocyte specific homeobox 6 [Cricetulus griseus]